MLNKNMFKHNLTNSEVNKIRKMVDFYQQSVNECKEMLPFIYEASQNNAPQYAKYLKFIALTRANHTEMTFRYLRMLNDHRNKSLEQTDGKKYYSAEEIEVRSIKEYVFASIIDEKVSITHLDNHKEICKWIDTLNNHEKIVLLITDNDTVKQHLTEEKRIIFVPLVSSIKNIEKDYANIIQRKLRSDLNIINLSTIDKVFRAKAIEYESDLRKQKYGYCHQEELAKLSQKELDELIRAGESVASKR